jgi:Zn-dependent membrane protease YugP
MDVTYLLFMIPGMLLALIAQALVKGRIARMHQMQNRAGLTGAETAQRILDANGIANVRIEEVAGFLSDHYSPGEKVLRLSPEIYSGRSVSSLAVAAHECGHALQDKEAYTPLLLRSTVAPVATLGSNLAMILVVLGGYLQLVGLFKIACILFSAFVLFTLITLPVEFDASARALRQLETLQLSGGDEWYSARKVLSAAALTYVAAAATAILQLLWFLYRAGLIGGRRRD